MYRILRYLSITSTILTEDLYLFLRIQIGKRIQLLLL